MPAKNPRPDARNRSPADPRRRRLLAGAAGLGLAAGLAGSAAAQPPAGDREFAGRTAFVTGGARGIGYSCAEALAKAGANVVLYDIAGQIEQVRYPLATLADLNDAQARIKALGVGCTAVQGDVRDGARLKDALRAAAAKFGSVDMLVANAGVLLAGPLERFTAAETDVVLGVNLAGVIKAVQAAMPIMRRQKSGRIVAISSIVGRAGSEAFPVYSASKWGVIGLAKSAARIMGRFNVTCNAVCPSLVRTKLVANDYFLKTLVPANPTVAALDEVGRRAHALPVGFIEPEQIADAVKFLCSDAAALITGDVFDVAAGTNASFPA